MNSDLIFFRRSCASPAVTTYSLSSPKLTAPVTLALVTDLHETQYGSDQEILLSAIGLQKPDLILLGGDLFDAAAPQRGAACLVKQLAALWPCFYVSGNHEEWTRQMPRLRSRLSRLGIRNLRGNVETILLKGQLLQIGGVDDPHAFTRSHHSLHLSRKWKKQLHSCTDQLSPEHFSILLSHRPELTGYYAESGFDLIACGHAHGGQVRLPICPGGLFAPHQGFFPKYAGGKYTLFSSSGIKKHASAMIVSRGLCRNHLPRIGNPPELVIIRLLPASPSSL